MKFSVRLPNPSYFSRMEQDQKFLWTSHAACLDRQQTRTPPGTDRRGLACVRIAGNYTIQPRANPRFEPVNRVAHGERNLYLGYSEEGMGTRRLVRTVVSLARRSDRFQRCGGPRLAERTESWADRPADRLDSQHRRLGSCRPIPG